MSLALAPAAGALVVPPRPKPFDRPMPLWRLLLQLRRNALVTWGEPAFEVDVVGRPFLGRQSLLVNAADGIRHVLIDNAKAYGRTPATIRILHPMIGDGLFLAEGEAWRHQRRTVAPAFAPRSMAMVATHAAAATDELVGRLGEGGPADLLRLMQRLALEVAGRALFSTAMERHGADVRRGMERYGRRLARPFVLDFVLPAEAPHPLTAIRRRAGREFKQVLERIIAERAAEGVNEPPRDLWDLLSTARDPETGEGFGDDALRDQIATLLIAGHETTALTLFWSLYLLALDPRWQEALADEAMAAPADAGLDELPVAKAVVQESLRLYPPAFTIVRVAKEPDVVMGRELPAGSLVVVAPWVLHRHKKHWHDPHGFDPSRFMPDAPPPDRFAYLPFGVGPRVCIGAQFALTEAAVVLSRLVRAFKIDLIGPKRVTPVAVVTTVPDRRPTFRLRPRAERPGRAGVDLGHQKERAA